MTTGDRFHSIDIMTGLLVLLLLFVSALSLPDILPWFSGTGSHNGGIDISARVISGFLFMTGMTVPFIISGKINNNVPANEISRSIFGRSIILITIGVLMVNTHRVNSELTGFSNYTWSCILFIAVFIIWNRYQDEEKKFFTIAGLRFSGLALLVFLVFKFRSGSFENGGSLITGWWELQGLMGWGFLITAFTYLAIRNSIFGTAIILFVFLLLNIFSQTGLTDFLKPVRPYIGVITDGYIPFVMLAGSFTSLIIKKYSESETVKTVTSILLVAAFSIAAGIVLKKSVIVSGGNHTPSFALINNGICMILFLLFHWLIDLKNWGRWFGFFKPAGENALTTYLFSFIIYNILWLCKIPVFFFRQSEMPLINIASSGVLAILLMLSASILIKLNVRLKI
jgi:heparan-alpha-glucosaminide N-acetyltransferase